MLEAFAPRNDDRLKLFSDALSGVNFSAAKSPKKRKLEHQPMRYLNEVTSEVFDSRFARADEHLD